MSKKIENRKRDNEAYTKFDEFMAHLDGLLGKDHPLYQQYRKQYEEKGVSKND
jgi:hypothetical protein